MQTIQLIKLLITPEMTDSSIVTSVVETLMEVIGSSVLQSNSKYDVIGKYISFYYSFYIIFDYEIIYYILNKQIIYIILIFVKMVNRQCL